MIKHRNVSNIIYNVLAMGTDSVFIHFKWVSSYWWSNIEMLVISLTMLLPWEQIWFLFQLSWNTITIFSSTVNQCLPHQNLWNRFLAKELSDASTVFYSQCFLILLLLLYSARGPGLPLGGQHGGHALELLQIFCQFNGYLPAE